MANLSALKIYREGEKQKAIGKSVAQRALASALQLWYILINAESRDDPTTTSDPQRVKLSS
jgi:Mg-chelatase subunit ChlI